MNTLKRKKINLKITFEILILTTMLALFTSTARFRTTLTGNKSAIVAIPILSSTTLVLEKIYPTMSPIEYDLIIRNTNGTIVSQVALNYCVDVENAGNLPLKIELYQLNNGVIEGQNLLTNGRTSSIYMSINEMIHNYKLVISWDNTITDYNDYKYSGETSLLTINVDAIQKN